MPGRRSDSLIAEHEDKRARNNYLIRLLLGARLAGRAVLRGWYSAGNFHGLAPLAPRLCAQVAAEGAHTFPRIILSLNAAV